jgi:hypothetical protein
LSPLWWRTHHFAPEHHLDGTIFSTAERILTIPRWWNMASPC